MNLAELEKKLLAAARANPPADRVPYAFEKRITARLKTRTVLDRWAVWSQALWRGAAGSLAVLVVLGACSFFLPQNNGGGNDLSQDFENTMLAAADQPDTDNAW